jgi:hypothetical protein
MALVFVSIDAKVVKISGLEKNYGRKFAGYK